MLFNSLEFCVFLPLVFVVYWMLWKEEDLFHTQLQNAFLLIASYVFYSWWNWRFLLLIVFSSFVDFTVGICISRENRERRRKLLLFLSVFVNLGLLAVFKYYNFFIASFVDAFALFGTRFSVQTLKVVLPVGISFYTFQTLSYSIDIYKRKLEPTRDIVAFFAFVSFFPQLVAGPIERATNLLPQFSKQRVLEFDQAADGMRQILWGLLKKVVIADNCARLADGIFANYASYSGSTLLLGAILFAFQIYGDFSGYSDIAIGTARLFGFSLMRNFDFPYFSRDVAEFWRRWHISLSTWFRDYIYIPLGGSKVKTFAKIRNTLIIFLISGLWHGANWTFVVWGFINALYFLPLLLMNRNRRNTDIVAQGKVLPSICDVLQMGITFVFTTIAWIFFRAESIEHAAYYITKMFSVTLFSVPEVLPRRVLVVLGIFVLVEWLQREKQHALQIEHIIMYRPLRWVTYYAILMVIFSLGGEQQQFIYFQF
jgi:alginate O-acetyltransferase complex protein AlgI